MISSICWNGGYHSKHYRRIGATECGMFDSDSICFWSSVAKKILFARIDNPCYLIQRQLFFLIVDSFLFSWWHLVSTTVILISHRSDQHTATVSLYRDPSYVLVRVHDERKTEATLLAGTPGEGVGPASACICRWQVGFCRYVVPSSRRCHSIDGERWVEYRDFLSPGKIYAYMVLSIRCLPRPTRNEANIIFMFIRFPSSR